MTAQFVSWKTHPYLDTEVIEWKRRIDLANAVFGRDGNTVDCAALHSLIKKYYITYVLFQGEGTKAPPDCDLLVTTFYSSNARIMKVIANDRARND